MTRLVLPALMLVCFASSANAQPGKFDKPKAIDQATIEAWQKRGFDGGWMRSHGGVTWLSSNYPKYFHDVYPAMWLTPRKRAITDDDLKDLPPVGIPFALHLFGRSEVTDAGLKHLSRLDNLARLHVSLAQVRDDGLRHLAGLKSLTALRLSLPRVTDEDVKQLAKLKNLATFSLALTGVDDDGLKPLVGLTNLTELGLTSTAVTDEGLRHLAGLTNLTALHLWNTEVSGTDLKPLAGLKKLTSLTLDSAKVTDDSLRALGEMGLLHALHQADIHGGPQGYIGDGLRPARPDDVRSINLNGTRVTGEGLKHLAVFPNLTNLYVTSSQLTRGGLKHLLDLKQLTVLGIGATEVTRADLSLLKGIKTLTHLRLPITDDTLRTVSEAGVFHLLVQAKAAGDKRASKDEEVVSFDLSEARIGAEGLKYVATLKNLATLKLPGIPVPEEQLKEFAKALPNCKITK